MKKIKNSSTNQITNNFGKITIKNWQCKTWKHTKTDKNGEKMEKCLEQCIVLGIKNLQIILSHKK